MVAVCDLGDVTIGRAEELAKNAIKLHFGLNHSGYLPEFVAITEGNTSDIEIGRTLQFPQRGIVAVDRGCCVYGWYNQLTEKKIFFITRLKSNTKFKVASREPVLKYKGLSSEQIIKFTGLKSVKECPTQLRRIGCRGKETGKHYVFLTNKFKLSAKTIADIYKTRWQVELFFKWIKQNLKIKAFVGTSKNAVMTQVWIAVCAYLLLAFIKFQSKMSKSKPNSAILQLNLFEKLDLMALLRGDPLIHENASNYWMDLV